GGRRNKISAGDILGALTSKNGIPGGDVGKIDRQDYITFVAVKRGSAARALKVMEEDQIKGHLFKAMIHDA
ncbi:DbpA RNA binding domain-containing protein, partial [Oceanispirochaeta sp.]|uniref:DbpA RNA binding domain-containing protein n=1 Tax=Oceanispirochaeta sp. TaxID=2035350 RepID=UPI0026099137